MSRKRTKEHTKWSKAVITRDKVCVICKSEKDLQAHHLNCYSYFPLERYKLSNGITICDFHHTLYHTSYNISFRAKTTKKDFNNFLELISKLEQHNKQLTH